MVPAPVARHWARNEGSAGAGNAGGSRKAGGPLRSIMSRRLEAFASRLVRAGRFHFVSTNFKNGRVVRHDV